MTSCPRCHTASLHRSHAHGVWVLACAHCWGLWLDREAAGTLFGTLADEATVDARDEGTRCPACAAALEPISLRGVAIDRCRPHGVWFDHTELDRVVQAREPTAGSTLGAFATGAAVLG